MYYLGYMGDNRKRMVSHVSQKGEIHNVYKMILCHRLIFYRTQSCRPKFLVEIVNYRHTASVIDTGQ